MGNTKCLCYGKKIDSRLINNQEMALRRLRSLHKRFLGNLDLFEKYKETKNTYIKEGYARKMKKVETIDISDKHDICCIIQFFIFRNQERSKWCLMQLQNIKAKA